MLLTRAAKILGALAGKPVSEATVSSAIYLSPQATVRATSYLIFRLLGHPVTRTSRLIYLAPLAPNDGHIIVDMLAMLFLNHSILFPGHELVLPLGVRLQRLR
jgi:hypothetical protein